MENFASLMSQLGNEPCMVQDSDEMFVLRQSDDYQSKVTLGNKLSAQYRFKEAIEAYSEALKIKTDDYLTYQRIAGACLTIRDFEQSLKYYKKVLELLSDEKPVAFTMGAYFYLCGEYKLAQEWLLKVLPSNGELEIAVIYWHTLCSYRLGEEPVLLKNFDDNMDVGHHEAYKKAVKVFKGTSSYREILESVQSNKNSLDYPIISYGIARFMDYNGDSEESLKLMDEILLHQDFWPCIAFLAAFGDMKER